MIRDTQERIYIFLDIDGVLNRQCDWANSDSIKALEQHFPIYGKIADGDRLDQIEQYVEQYGIRRYVIIDDDRTEYSRTDPHICFVDAKSGFSAKDARMCRKILG